MLRYGAVANQLSEILGARFVPNSKPSSGAVGTMLANVIDLYNAGAYRDCDFELWRLGLLAQQLTGLQEADSATFERLRKRLRQGTLSDYYGARQELSVACALRAASLSYSHDCPGRPDFSVINGTAGIECTSVHMTQFVEGDAFYKVQAALRSKAKKAYAGPRVALAVETTFIDARGALNRSKEEIAALLAGTRFGAVLLCCSMLVGNPPERYEQNDRRVDSDRITPELRDVLDAAYPFGSYTVERFAMASLP